MKKILSVIYVFILVFVLSILEGAVGGGSVYARQMISLNDGWGYKKQSETGKNVKLTPVTLPHTWNAEYPAGTTEYNRETMNYQRNLNVTAEMRQKRLFLYFEGVNSVADVFINGKHCTNHKGGYTAFCIEITDKVSEGDNLLEVWVSNAYRSDVLPISGDFNVYGGIHRPVHLIITENDCIAPDFYASPGIFIKPKKVTNDVAEFDIETVIKFKSSRVQGVKLRATVYDADGKQVAEDSGFKTTLHSTLKNPHLWNGKQNPYLYTVKVELLKDGKVVDEVTQQTGFRYFSVDKEKGFFLNGKHLDLHGFCRHDGVKGKGSALVQSDYQRDMEIIMESGATGMRLVHYPHGEPIYNLCDKQGICLWTELPLVGPGGYKYAGYIDNPDLKEHGRQVAKELVYQKYNHPSIFFWGLFNELLVNYDHPKAYISELNDTIHRLDPSRLTCFATCVDQQQYLGCADLCAWNKYFGWYNDEKGEDKAGPFFDNCKLASGEYPVGLSEYGAGAGIHTYMWPLGKIEDKNRIHPQEKQCLNHEQNWAAYGKRNYLWCKFIWQFADMQSGIRHEGEEDGMNDKGLVTFDRKGKKDAFYFYKANWRKDVPVLYIAERDFKDRTSADAQVRVYTNLPKVDIWVNGRKHSVKTDTLCRAILPQITLQQGQNTIRVEGKFSGKKVSDECIWIWQV